MGTNPSGPHLYLRHNRRVESGFEKVNEIIDSGVLGDVFSIKLTRNGYSRRCDWQTISEFGGGQLLNWGPHIVDHCRVFAGVHTKRCTPISSTASLRETAKIS